MDEHLGRTILAEENPQLPITVTLVKHIIAPNSLGQLRGVLTVYR
jgi:hypothetical protein